MSRTADGGFLTHLSREVRLLEVLLLAAVPIVLGGVALLPVAREELVFQRESPTLVAAYTAYFVHLDATHLLGNVATYLAVVPVAYLLAVLSGRRQLFWTTWITLLVAFPFALSAMQLSFPDARTLLGFSGINAGFVGLLCFLLISYAGATLAGGIDERDAPALLFWTVGLISWVTLPPRAWRVELAALTVCTGLAYLASALSRVGLPTRAGVRAALTRPGYAELAVAGLCVLFAYPFLGFGGRRSPVTADGVFDVYIHLLGYCLAFIVVYVFVFAVEQE